MKAAADRIRVWRQDPVAFVREVFQVEPDAWQAEMLRAFPAHNRLAAKACKGPGKTTIMSWLGWNFLACYPHCKVPCTSITGDNLRDGLWSEFSKWQRRSPLLMETFEWTATRIFAKEAPQTWFASARAWSKSADPQAMANTLAGIHSDYLLFLVDEVGDIPDAVVGAAEGALTSGKVTKLVMMGNPTRTDGPLWRACTVDRKHWHLVEITGDPDSPNRSPRIDIDEARAQIEKYGRDSYIVRVNILGQFPERQADKLLGPEQVAAAMHRVVRLEEQIHDGLRLGLDPARYGDDEAVLHKRQARASWPATVWRGLSVTDLGEQVIRVIDKERPGAVFIDSGGLGAGVYDFICARGYGHVAQEVNFGSRAIEAERFENRRAEMYWNAAEWVKTGGGSLAQDPLLSEELCAPIYFFDRRGRICIEPKADVKKRIGRSPDRADGFVLTFAGPVAPVSAIDDVRAALETVGGGRGQIPTDYDPYAAGRL